MVLHCCILALFSHTCLSTLENKMWFFFFCFTGIYNKPQIHHSWSHTHTNWFETPLTSRAHLNTHAHTHSSASVCGHRPSFHPFPREQERTIMHLCPGWRGNINKRVDPLVLRTLHITATCQFQTLTLNSSSAAFFSGYTDAFMWLSCLCEHQ